MIPGSANPLLLATAAGAGGYEVSRSLRLNSSDSAYLSRTPASAGNRKTWTWAGWVKRSSFGTSQYFFGNYFNAANDGTSVRFTTSDQINIFDLTSGSFAYQLTSTQVFRDPSAWYHFVIALDTTQATAANRLKIYVNGSEITTWATSTYPTQNTDYDLNNTQLHAIGRSGSFAGQYFDGYLAEIHFIDGQALDPTSFGEFDANGVWQPIAYTGSYGTNGFHLPFSDNSTAAALGTDTSGNSNTWTVNNISVAAGAGNDSLVDTPTNYGTDTGAGGEVRGNYATWNPLARGADATLTNGNLDISYGSSSTPGTTVATQGVSSGKWYWEVTFTASTISDPRGVIGITPLSASSSSLPGSSVDSYSYYDGLKYNNGSFTAYGPLPAVNDVIGVALDLDTGEIAFYQNGANLGVAFTGLPAKTYFPAIGDGSASQTYSAATNFGQRQWAYQAPAGFKALCTTNLPEPTIADGSTAMDVKLYTGNGSTQTISGLGFSPDLVWLKGRSDPDKHGLYDIVRGATKILKSEFTDAEDTQNGVTAFNSDGFNIGNYAESNGTSRTYVAWAWDAGSSTVSNDAGSITSQVRANPSAGFSIVTYTGNGTSGSTVGHGLGVAPSFIITKSRSDAYAWQVGHASLGWTARLSLNTSAAASTTSIAWNDTAPTSTVFTAGDSALVNGSSYTYVAYCFAPVNSYSAFGSYQGNGSADGPFVYTGFRPRYVLIKNTQRVASWQQYDSARTTYNVMDYVLFSDTSSAETQGTGFSLDFLSNGFKIRNAYANFNASGESMIYAAFAESPFSYSRAR